MTLRRLPGSFTIIPQELHRIEDKKEMNEICKNIKTTRSIYRRTSSGSALYTLRFLDHSQGDHSKNRGTNCGTILQQNDLDEATWAKPSRLRGRAPTIDDETISLHPCHGCRHFLLPLSFPLPAPSANGYCSVN